MTRMLNWKSFTAATAGVVCAGVLVAPADAAAAGHRPLTKPPKTQVEAPVPVHAFTPQGASTLSRADAAARDYRVRAQFPSPGVRTVDGRPGGGWRPAGGGSTFAVGATREASGVASGVLAKTTRIQSTLRVLPQHQIHAYGLEGVAFRLSTSGGNSKVAGTQVKTPVRVDYSSFKDAIGGDWASRLSIGVVTDCSAVRGACTPFAPLPTSNNERTHVLKARVGTPLGARVTLAVAASPSGDQGDFTSTPLEASSQWDVGLQTGDFSWTYPVKTVPVAGDLAPTLSVGYDSQSVDGRTPSSNNQTSWVGEGMDVASGYIGREYESCPDATAGHTKSDLCWKTDNATLNFMGQSTKLIHDTGTSEWRAQDDQGWRVRRLTDTSLGNGDNKGEYWELTDQNGTRYYFGQERLTPGGPSTDSTWTVPVFGDDANDPCHDAAGGWCQRAWQWNLDYVVDVHGNSMTYDYTAEHNHYGLNGNFSQPQYDRGGYLSEIDYGQVAGLEGSASPAARILLDTAERCTVTDTFACNADQLTSANASHWPDVPFDQLCDSQATCGNVKSPAFFSRKKLVGIRTQVYDGGSYRAVDTIALKQVFVPSGDGSGQSLWLDSISRTGKDGGDLSVPDVTFNGSQMANRVLTGGSAPLMRWRVNQIKTETGGTIMVTYSDPDCTPTDLPVSPSVNQRRCFPVYWQENQFSQPTLNWMHKYVVTQVTENDVSGTVPIPVTTKYTYSGGGAWHYDDNEITKAKFRTYGDWRGYNTVEVSKGTAADSTPTYDKYLFMRGMNGDHLPDGTTRKDIYTVASNGGKTLDDDHLNGFQKEHIQKNGASGEVVSDEIDDPWLSPITADNGTDTAQMQKIGTVLTRKQKVGTTSYVSNTVTTKYDDKTGLPVWVDDAGDDALASDNSCVRTDYGKQNFGKWLLTPVQDTQTVSVGCGTAVTPAVIVSETQYSFDNQAYNTMPTTGDVTTQKSLVGAIGAGTFQTTNTQSYDARGRVVSTTDGVGATQTISYTPTGEGASHQGPVRSMTATNALNQSTTTTYDVARGLPLSVTDPNNKVTSATYDPLGRTTAVWQPGRVQGTDTPDTKYTYQLRNNDYSGIKTETLLNDGTYKVGWDLYDALLRPVETQSPALDASGSELLTTTRYDSAGNKVKVLGPYPAADPITLGSYYSPVTSAVYVNHRHVFDGAGRPIADIYQPKDVESWRTTTTYDANKVTVDPPTGATPTTDVSDWHGNVLTHIEYLNAGATGTTQTTTYTYDAMNRVRTEVDPQKNTWTWTHDLQGNVTSTRDPDSGLTSTMYDLAGEATTVTDATQQSLFTKYDALGRPIALYDGTGVDPTKLRASWLYDKKADGTPFMAGQLTSSTRYVTPGNTATAITSEITGYDSQYRTTGTKVTVPSISGLTNTAAGDLAGTYTTSVAYNYDGTVNSKTFPVAYGVPNETTHYTYNKYGLPLTLGGYDSVVSTASYTPFGEISQLTQGNVSGKLTFSTSFYDEGTRRLTRQLVSNQALSGYQLDNNYTYDGAGNVTSVADNSGTKDIQCFNYDFRAQVKDAWTVNSGACPTAPSQSNMGTTAASYWTTYTYDAIGNRSTETDHVKTGSNNTLLTFVSPASGVTSGPNAATGAGGPHSVTKYTQKVGTAAATTLATYTYDAAGDMTKRGSETDTWDSEGNLVGTKTGTAAATQMVYDVEGNRILRRESTGTTTLYLDSTEITLSATAKSSQRWYDFGGDTIATRSSAANLYILAADSHHTAQVQVDTTTAAYSKRRFDPFGGTRSGGTAPANWKGDHGFIDKPVDADGLVQMGARYYDPVTGKFISPDPEHDPMNVAQANTYVYAANNPMTTSDPTGRFEVDDYGNPVVHHSSPTSNPTGTTTTSSTGCTNPGYTQPSSPPVTSEPPPPEGPKFVDEFTHEFRMAMAGAGFGTAEEQFAYRNEQQNLLNDIIRGIGGGKGATKAEHRAARDVAKSEGYGVPKASTMKNDLGKAMRLSGKLKMGARVGGAALEVVGAVWTFDDYKKAGDPTDEALAKTLVVGTASAGAGFFATAGCGPLCGAGASMAVSTLGTWEVNTKIGHALYIEPMLPSMDVAGEEAKWTAGVASGAYHSVTGWFH